MQAGENGYLSIDEYSKRVNAMRQIHPDKENLWQQLEKYVLINQNLTSLNNVLCL
jgi:exodeoxyribonuclease-1